MSDVVGNVLKYVLDIKLLRMYNWFGLKRKLKFGTLKIATVICSTYEFRLRSFVSSYNH